MSKSARKRERVQDQIEEEGYRRFIGFDGLPWWRFASPARNITPSSWRFFAKSERERERSLWKMGARCGGRFGLGSKGGGARSMVTVSSEKKWLGVEGGSDQWVPSVSEKKKQRGKWRKGFRGAAGLTALGPRGWPSWLSFPFSFLLLLFFSDF
jgi:hypothetical protein